MDTPGLNESKEADLKHMADLVEYLCKERTIRACIFVVKSDSKIDQQYKDTIKYYSMLLSFLFSRNVFVVMTAHPTDERSKAMRSSQGIDFEKNADNVKAEIVESAQPHMSYTPKLFAIDSIPYEENEKMHSLEVRKAILSCIFSLEAVKVEDLKVVKTQAIKEEDIGKAEELKGKLAGYDSRLQEIKKSAAVALNETSAKEGVVSNINSTLYSFRQRLSELDRDERVAINHSVGNGAIKVYTTFYVKKKDIHQMEISQLRSQIAQQESNLSVATRDAQNCRERYTKYQDKVKPLEDLMNETKRDVSELSCDVMTLEQVRCRCLN